MSDYIRHIAALERRIVALENLLIAKGVTSAASMTLVELEAARNPPQAPPAYRPAAVRKKAAKKRSRSR